MKTPPRRARRESGFTLVEMMVVIVIISILASLLLPALFNARKKEKMVLAMESVRAIHAACIAYHEEFGMFPPDTGAFNTGDDKELYFEKESIYRYLGRKIEDTATGKTYGPYFNIKIQFLKDETYVDPWGEPYQMDALHVTVNKEKGVKQGEVTRLGSPYPAGTDEDKQTIDCKVWSSGPDKKWVNGSNVVSGKGADQDDEDNITSWAE